MTNADWISKKISDFLINTKNQIRIWKISLIILIISIIAIFITKWIWLVALISSSLGIFIGFTIVLIDNWMEQEHKEDVMDILTVANKVEEELKKWKMVGDRIGSGFDCQTNTRDVQYMYGEEKDQESITNLITDVVSNFEGEWSVSIRYKLDDFTFYISPKE